MNTALLLLWLSTQTCDFATTNVALSQSGNFAEANPLLKGSRTRLNSVKVSVNVLAFVAWHKNKEKKAARILPIAMSASAGVACAWNLKQLAR